MALGFGFPTRMFFFGPKSILKKATLQYFKTKHVPHYA